MVYSSNKTDDVVVVVVFRQQVKFLIKTLCRDMESQLKVNAAL